MFAAIFTVVGVIVFWIISDAQKTRMEVKSDPVRFDLKQRYPAMLKDLYLKGFDITQDTGTGFIFKKVLRDHNLLCDLHITSQTGKQIQVLVQTHTISPKKHLDTKTFHHSLDHSDEEMRDRVAADLLDFERPISSFDTQRIIGY